MSLAPGAKNSLTGKEYFLFLSVGCWCHYIDRESESNWLLLALTVTSGWAQLQGPARASVDESFLLCQSRVGSAQETHSSGSAPMSRISTRFPHVRSWVKTHVLSIILELKLGPQTVNTPDGGINVSIKSSDVNTTFCNACCLLWGGSQLTNSVVLMSQPRHIIGSQLQV